MNGNREYKSDVFSMLMEDAANALEVYNALNGSDYADPEEVEMIRLEKGVSLSVRNDASFLVGMHVSFYEHQSTYNPNMALRSLIYFVSALEEWLKEKDLYGRKLITIPTPHFVVFYNGTEERPEYEEMRLSEAFFHRTDEPELEVKCRVYNINPKHNRELKERSAVLAGYTYFVEKVRTYREDGIPLEEAIDSAIADCIKGHILEDFFEKRKDEVKKMTQLDYTWERREKLIRKEEYAEGMEQGRSEEKAEDILKVLGCKGKGFRSAAGKDPRREKSGAAEGVVRLRAVLWERGGFCGTDCEMRGISHSRPNHYTMSAEKQATRWG